MSTARIRRHARLLGLALVAVLAAGALTGGLALAAGQRHGPKIIAPHKGHVYKVGSRIHFKVRDRSSFAKKYHVWITVASKKRVKHGQLKEARPKESGDFSQMKRHKHGVYAYTPPHYTFPEWYMQRPGKYYWQAHHIDCGARPKSCDIVSKISSFRVVR